MSWHADSLLLRSPANQVILHHLVFLLLLVIFQVSCLRPQSAIFVLCSIGSIPTPANPYDKAECPSSKMSHLDNPMMVTGTSASTSITCNTDLEDHTVHQLVDGIPIPDHPGCQVLHNLAANTIHALLVSYQSQITIFNMLLSGGCINSHAASTVCGEILYQVVHATPLSAMVYVTVSTILMVTFYPLKCVVWVILAVYVLRCGMGIHPHAAQGVELLHVIPPMFNALHQQITTADMRLQVMAAN
ncbi:hypothetical protein EV401DRAFT_1891870 [Pisolithus croceorrhizus]|nr:hypothetical protein EV401DRAFT_1891870 [Pisolithus croceorrhizus]